MAELGFGVLEISDWSRGRSSDGEARPARRLGRSDHFGGIVGPAAFSSPSAVIHLDRIYPGRPAEDLRRLGRSRLSGGRVERIISSRPLRSLIGDSIHNSRISRIVILYYSGGKPSGFHSCSGIA
jgi:hypothetical protein